MQQTEEIDFSSGKGVIADNRGAYNFSPGPCQLPRTVLEQSQDGLFDFMGTGQSVMELSHRQDEFRYVQTTCKNEIRKFLKVPDNFRVLL